MLDFACAQVVRQKERQAPVIYNVDTVILGNGISAVSAAVTASRNGDSVLLVCDYAYTGGAAVTKLFTEFEEVPPDSPDILKEIFEKLKKSDPYHSSYKNGKLNQEWLKHALDEILVENNINVIFYSIPCGMIIEDGVFKVLLLQNKEGLQAVRASTLIDCTDDFKSLSLIKQADSSRNKKQNCISIMRLKIDDVSLKKEKTVKLKSPGIAAELRLLPLALSPGECIIELYRHVRLNPYKLSDVSGEECSARAMLAKELEKLIKNDDDFSKSVVLLGAMETDIIPLGMKLPVKGLPLQKESKKTKTHVVRYPGKVADSSSSSVIFRNHKGEKVSLPENFGELKKVKNIYLAGDSKYFLSDGSSWSVDPLFNTNLAVHHALISAKRNKSSFPVSVSLKKENDEIIRELKNSSGKNYTDWMNVPPADLEIEDRTDVVVIGGGTAGLTAAISAASNGADVILIEQYAFFGGTAVAGGVSQGGNSNLLKILKSQGYYSTSGLGGFNPEVMKKLLQKIALRAGVKVKLRTFACGTWMDGRKIKGIVVQPRTGKRQIITGKVFIDCTGDGDIAASAGAEYTKGNRSKGITQPVTQMYFIRQTGKNATKGALGPWPAGYGCYGLQTRLIACNAMDVAELSKSEILGRQAVKKEFLGREGECKGDIKILFSGPQIGVRETRQIKGDYVLSARDLYEGRKFGDKIVSCGYMMDVRGEYVDPVRGYDIPYRCMLPAGVTNLINAGRHISATHEAMASIRLQVTLMPMGQAAGIAAAEALKKDCNPRKVDPAEIRKKLKRQRDIYENLYYGANSSKLKIKVSSTLKSTDGKPENLVDGNLRTRWISDRTKGPHQIEVNLPRPAKLTKIEIICAKGPFGIGPHFIEFKENGKWKKLEAETKSRDSFLKVYSFLFKKRKIQDFRIVIEKGSSKDDIARINELRYE